jgi:hypothetical protein
MTQQKKNPTLFQEFWPGVASLSKQVYNLLFLFWYASVWKYLQKLKIMEAEKLKILKFLQFNVKQFGEYKCWHI